MTRTAIWLGALALGGATQGLAMAADSGGAESAAIFGAAGFKAKGNKWVRCADDVTQSYMPGTMEREDLNGDGAAEAWVKESSLYCYGHAAEAFVLLARDANGRWTALLDEVGVPVVLKTRSQGWPDIEVGGPGAGPFPVYRYSGKTYVRKKK
jgi:hypothetical protein